MSPPPSFHEWLSRLRRCDDATATEFFHRFRCRLIGLARQQLDGRLRRKLDPEDVVQSVFRTVLRRLAKGEFELGDWDSLWSLLTCIIIRKCGHWKEHFRTQAHDINRETDPQACADDSSPSWEFLSREPGPEEAARLLETVQQMLAGLDDREQQVVMLSLQGYEVAEVSAHTGCTRSKVYRVLRLVRSRLERLRDADT